MVDTTVTTKANIEFPVELVSIQESCIKSKVENYTFMVANPKPWITQGIFESRIEEP